MAITSEEQADESGGSQDVGDDQCGVHGGLRWGVDETIANAI